MKKLWNRQDLKSFFRKGQTPSEVHFEYLIDSTFNKVDDGLAKNDDDGLRLAPTGNGQNVMSVFKHQSDPNPDWQLKLKNNDNGNGTSLSFDRCTRNDGFDHSATSALVLANNGQVGVGTSNPRTTLEVEGALGSRSRVGTYALGQVPGDGRWHKIVDHLNDMAAFEIVARIDGPKNKGRYAFAHAIALGAFGGGRNKIKSVCAHFGWFWNRIEFRWNSVSPKDYSLEVRTRSHYSLDEEKNPYMIRYHITQLWDESEFRELKISSNNAEK
jgi:hypothetical protein